MKKIALLLLTAAMILAIAVGAAAAAANENPMYANAADGDLLYTVDFRGDDAFSPKPSEYAVDAVTYTPTDDGSGIHVKGVDGFDEDWCFWGGSIAGLKADATTQYTLTYKVKMNGESGKNNSIGVGGLSWNISEGKHFDWRFFNNYGNYNSEFPEGEDTPNRSALSVSAHKISDYTNGIEDAAPDKDGYLTCRIDFDGPANVFKAYALTDDGWTLLEEQAMGEPKDTYTNVYVETKDVGVYFYTYYEVVDADIKDVRLYKGVGLTDEQLAGEKAPTYTYPASGESGSSLIGTVIGNETGWDGTEGSGSGAVASTPSILPYQMEEYGQKSSDVYKVATAPTVDGVVTEGEYGDPITVFNLGDEGTHTKFVELTEDELKKVVPDDCTVYMTYDDTYLYLAVTCIDDSHMTPLSGTGIWDGDYLEFDLTRVSDDFADHSNRVCFALGIDNNGGICGYFDKAPDYADGSYSGVVWQDENDKAMVTLNDNLVTYETKFDWKGILGSEGAPESALYYVQICCSDEELYEKSEYEAYLGRLQNTPTMSDEVKAEIEGLGGKYIYNVLNFAGDAPVAAPTFTYPASGESGSFLSGTVIGNATGWGGNADAGAAAAFDGNPATFFDPLGKGDGYCGMDMGKKVVLEKVVILSRDGWNDRFKGAEIRGNNEDNVDTAVTLWKSDVVGTNPEYFVITDFENNDGYQYYFYYNTENHGDVAEVEFYGTDYVEPAPVAEEPETEPVGEEPETPAVSSVDEELEAKAEAPNTFDLGVIAAVAAVISLAGFAAAKKKH